MQGLERENDRLPLTDDFATLMAGGRIEEIRAMRASLVSSALEDEQSCYFLCRKLTRFNRSVIRAAIDLHVRDHPWLGECTFLEFGSGGREEQVIGSDQDNGLLYRMEPDPEEMEDAGQSLVMTLDAAGLPLCPGGVMLNSPDWRGDLEQWLDRLAGWLTNPREKGPWQSGLILDFTPVHGSDPSREHMEDALELRRRLWHYVRTKPIVLRLLVQEMSQYRLPLTFFGAFITEKDGPWKGHLDIKHSILAHITNGSRVLALKYSIDTPSTYERIVTLTEDGHFGGSLGSALLDAWEWLQRQRHYLGLQCYERGEPPHNYLNPSDMPREERQRLKASIQAAEKLVRLVQAGAGL